MSHTHFCTSCGEDWTCRRADCPHDDDDVATCPRCEIEAADDIEVQDIDEYATDDGIAGAEASPEEFPTHIDGNVKEDK